MGRPQSYKDLKVYQLAIGLVVDVHKMSLVELPKFEMYEEGSQIRRSVKSVKSNIVEGYGRRKYKQDFIVNTSSFLMFQKYLVRIFSKLMVFPAICSQ